jgi:hypothetical protein
MEPWQERVVTEKSELDARIYRLRAVLEKPDTYPLDLIARDLMSRQLAYMLAYSSTLRERIENFGA